MLTKTEFPIEEHGGLDKLVSVFIDEYERETEKDDWLLISRMTYCAAHRIPVQTAIANAALGITQQAESDAAEDMPTPTVTPYETLKPQLETIRDALT